MNRHRPATHHENVAPEALFDAEFRAKWPEADYSSRGRGGLTRPPRCSVPIDHLESACILFSLPPV